MIQMDEFEKEYFNEGVEEICIKRIKGYAKIKNSLLNEIKVLVREGIDEYEKGEIKFRF